MRTALRRIGLLCVVFALSGATSVESEAAARNACVTIHLFCGGSSSGNDHSTSRDGTWGGTHHSGCMYCVNGTPTDCHGGCADALLDADDRTVYAAAELASREGDLRALLELGEEASRFLRFNAARQSVQLLSCDGATVTANHAVPGAMMSLAVLLPSVDGTSRLADDE